MSGLLINEFEYIFCMISKQNIYCWVSFREGFIIEYYFDVLSKSFREPTSEFSFSRDYNNVYCLSNRIYIDGFHFEGVVFHYRILF